MRLVPLILARPALGRCGEPHVPASNLSSSRIVGSGSNDADTALSHTANVGSSSIVGSESHDALAEARGSGSHDALGAGRASVRPSAPEAP